MGCVRTMKNIGVAKVFGPPLAPPSQGGERNGLRSHHEKPLGYRRCSAHPPWPPLHKGGKGMGCVRTMKNIGIAKVFGPPPWPPPSQGGERDGLRLGDGACSCAVLSSFWQTALAGLIEHARNGILGWVKSRKKGQAPMRVLVAITHFYSAQRTASPDGRWHGSVGDAAAVRARALWQCVASLHQLYGPAQCIIEHVTRVGGMRTNGPPARSTSSSARPVTIIYSPS